MGFILGVITGVVIVFVAAILYMRHGGRYNK